MKILQKKAKIRANAKIFGRYHKIILESPEIARQATPGQFVMLKVGSAQEPLLRRPFSIHKAGGPVIEILYEAVGKGTEILAKRKTGEYIDLLGPLGNGFNYKSQRHNATCLSGRPCLPAGRQATSQVLVAGGMGVAPLFFLAQKLKNYKGLVLIGARTKKQILCEKEFQKSGFSVKIATDNGSAGFRGKVTDLLENLLRAPSAELRAIYACGPRPMLKEISRLSGKYKIPSQISLEEHMACGIGACLGCVVNTQEGFKRVCKEGPVFKAQEIIW
jgi:dihydroorotate dehydrogenase electron transfer subunit